VVQLEDREQDLLQEQKRQGGVHLPLVLIAA